MAPSLVTCVRRLDETSIVQISRLAVSPESTAMYFPSGLHAGRRFDAVVFVSCRIGDAASLTYAVTRARNAARYSARSTTSLLPVISALGRARRAKYPKRLPGQRDGEYRNERSTKQER